MNVFVSVPNKLLFFNIPKNASTTIRKSLNATHVKYSSIKNKEQFKTFTVLRNPYKRIISSYQEVLKCRSDAINLKFLTTAEYFKLYKNNEIEKSFKEFLNQLEITFFDKHVSSQKSCLEDINVNINDIDFVLNMNNNIQKEFNKMTKSLNIPIEIKANLHPSDVSLKSKIQKIIDTNDDIKNKIYKIYKKDFELIQYCEKNIWK